MTTPLPQFDYSPTRELAKSQYHNFNPAGAIQAGVITPDDKPLPITSSAEPDFSAEQIELFHAVLEHLNEKKVPYVVAGATALREHTGIARNTKDLDVFLPAEDVGAALESLQEAGFETEVPDPVWLAKAHRGEYFVDLITGMSNAAIFVDQSWIDRGIPCTLFGTQVKVLAPEELIASKLFVTRRERFDGADIAHVIFATRARLDWDRVLHLCGEHWEMLLWTLVLFHYVYPAHSQLVPRRVWDELLGRFQAQLDAPDAKARFRGSLVDPPMFNIDIAEWGMPNILEEYRARRLQAIEAAEEPAA
ncbi:MAG: nucleotidyltransferase [Terriglobales bacterium]